MQGQIGGGETGEKPGEIAEFSGIFGQVFQIS
jgi:hypothetical protein